jgi:hypothetical protein
VATIPEATIVYNGSKYNILLALVGKANKNIQNKVKYNTNNVHDTKLPSETGMCPDSYYIYIYRVFIHINEDSMSSSLTTKKN